MVREEEQVWFQRLVIVDHECRIRYIRTGFTAFCQDQMV